MLPVVGQKVNLVAGTPAVGDTYAGGLRYKGEAVLSGLGLTIANMSGGLPVDSFGQLCIVDATLGLPVNTQYQNGLPLAPGGLCTSTAGMVNWSNGLPMDANGAVCI